MTLLRRELQFDGWMDIIKMNVYKRTEKTYNKAKGWKHAILTIIDDPFKIFFLLDEFKDTFTIRDLMEFDYVFQEQFPDIKDLKRQLQAVLSRLAKEQYLIVVDTEYAIPSVYRHKPSEKSLLKKELAAKRRYERQNKVVHKPKRQKRYLNDDVQVSEWDLKIKERQKLNIFHQ